MLDIEISFLNHILPQMISMLIVFYTLFMLSRFYANVRKNHYQIGNFAFAMILLLFGKASVILFFEDVFLVKNIVDTTLMIYFSIMLITLFRTTNIPKLRQMGLFTLLIIACFLMVDQKFEQSLLIFFADSLLVLVCFFSFYKARYILIASFSLLGLINLGSYFFGIGYIGYAWLEIIGQLLFLKAMQEIIIEESRASTLL